MDPASALTLVSTVVGPLLKAAGEDHVKKSFGRALAALSTDETDALVRLADRCLGEWLAVALLDLMEEYEDPSRCEQFLVAYREPLSRFLSNAVVRSEVLHPLTSVEPRTPDSNVLARQWTFLELPTLPQEFKLSVICEKYARRVRKAAIIDPELRQRVITLRAEEQARYLRGLRGVWPDFDLDVYADRMKKRYRALDLSALVPPDRDDASVASISLRDVFVPPRARDGSSRTELPKDVLEQLVAAGFANERTRGAGTRVANTARTGKVRPVLEKLASERRLVLLGDPGAGKSTIARFVLLSLLDPPEPAPPWATPLQDHLPLLIELRDYNVRCTRGECQGFLEYLHLLGKTQGYKLNHVDLDEHLKSRPALIIFDGLDEVFEAQARNQAIEEIIGFSTDFPRARVVVTSRVVGYYGASFREAGFSEATIVDLDKSEIMAFSRGWFSIVFRDRPDEAKAREQRIQRAVDGSKAIALLAGNPLLLTIIAIIARFQELPRDRARLYEHAVRVLCHHWDFTFHGLTTKGLQDDVMDDERKLALLRQVAWQMQSSADGLVGNAIVESDLRAAIRAFFQASLHQAPDVAELNAVAMIDHLRSRNFILCLHGPGVYGFVHRTFLEFLCATAVVRRFEKERSMDEVELVEWAASHADDDAWREILRLLCGLLAPTVSATVISALTERNALCALQCLAEVNDLEALGSVTESALTAGIREIFDAKVVPWETSYAALRQEVLTLAPQFPARRELYPLLEFVLDTAHHDDDVLRALWGDEPRACHHIVCSALSPEPRRVFATELLGRVFGAHREAVNALLTLAAESGGSARPAAAEGLGRVSRVRQDVRPVVQTLMEDSDYRVRASAANGLAGASWADKLLEDAAARDPHAQVRAASFAALPDSLFMSDFGKFLAFALAEPVEFAREQMLDRLETASHVVASRHREQRLELTWALKSEERHARVIALGVMARRKGREAAILVSEDLDGIPPFLDPAEDVSLEHVREVAAKLDVTEAEARQKFEAMANEFCLVLSWETRPKQGSAET